MLPNPTLTTFILIIGVSVFSFIMLLPALLELKKPKDAGPRRIADKLPGVQPILIVNLEEDYKFDQRLAAKILNVIAVLPNLET